MKKESRKDKPLKDDWVEVLINTKRIDIIQMTTRVGFVRLKTITPKR